MNNDRANRARPVVQGESVSNLEPCTTSSSPATHRASVAAQDERPLTWKFWRNRRGEAVVVSIEPFEGKTVLHVRQYFTDAQGRLLPTKKGICIDALRLPDLAGAVNRALVRARELGLIPPEGKS
jgi:hypothetical protein